MSVVLVAADSGASVLGETTEDVSACADAVVRINSAIRSNLLIAFPSL